MEGLLIRTLKRVTGWGKDPEWLASREVLDRYLADDYEPSEEELRRMLREDLELTAMGDVEALLDVVELELRKHEENPCFSARANLRQAVRHLENLRESFDLYACLSRAHHDGHHGSRRNEEAIVDFFRERRGEEREVAA